MKKNLHALGIGTSLQKVMSRDKTPHVLKVKDHSSHWHSGFEHQNHFRYPGKQSTSAEGYQ